MVQYQVQYCFGTGTTGTGIKILDWDAALPAGTKVVSHTSIQFFLIFSRICQIISGAPNPGTLYCTKYMQSTNILLWGPFTCLLELKFSLCTRSCMIIMVKSFSFVSFKNEGRFSIPPVNTGAGLGLELGRRRRNYTNSMMMIDNDHACFVFNFVVCDFK